MARDCRYRGRSAPVEARGRGSKTDRNQVAVVQGETDQTPTKSERLRELQNELRKAELESALDDVRGVLLNITSDMDKKEERLGPTVTTTMELKDANSCIGT